MKDGNHLPGVQNTQCDRLSRGESPESLGYEESKIRRIVEGDAIWRLIALCDPLNLAVTENEISEKIDALRTVVAELGI